MTHATALTADKLIFDFELDFAGELKCIPMVVRLKLDLAGVKLSLRHWNRFSLAERQGLVHRPCQTLAEIAEYRAHLGRLIETCAGEQAVELAAVRNPPWANASRVPTELSDYAVRQGLAPPSAAKWAALAPLQRFALLKLTRPGHDNDNFAPAMAEFGLAESPTV